MREGGLKVGKHPPGPSLHVQYVTRMQWTAGIIHHADLLRRSGMDNGPVMRSTFIDLVPFSLRRCGMFWPIHFDKCFSSFESFSKIQIFWNFSNFFVKNPKNRRQMLWPSNEMRVTRGPQHISRPEWLMNMQMRQYRRTVINKQIARCNLSFNESSSPQHPNGLFHYAALVWLVGGGSRDLNPL